MTRSNPAHSLSQFDLTHAHYQVDGGEWPVVTHETLGRILADMQPYRRCSIPVLVTFRTPATYHVTGDGQSQFTSNLAYRYLLPNVIEIE